MTVAMDRMAGATGNKEGRCEVFRCEQRVRSPWWSKGAWSSQDQSGVEDATRRQLRLTGWLGRQEIKKITYFRVAVLLIYQG
ncbi:hypothetical protein NDU88_002571 [Pleurodeles waltl]|uniref:Uncharacterized protein n=1 Tax=Pleurodeles waltl TaxID=8319 RepID=A0AAV7WQB9_PLEWA|nr:hypothetical protein NDU88_002571 [Pleurodeles waltl]